MKKFLFAVLLFVGFLTTFVTVKDVFAQCSGSVTCLQQLWQCTPQPCGGPLEPACNCSWVDDTYSGSCFTYANNSCGPMCNSLDHCCNGASCSAPPSCPSGQVFCGGCISGCRQNTQTCTDWIDQECSGGGGGSDCSWCAGSAECGASGGSFGGEGSGWCNAPLGECCISAPPPPPCAPSCSGPSCGQSDGCGGSCSNSDNGSPPTPTISAPTNNGIALMDPNTLQITINWNNTNKADRYNIQVFPQGSDCTDPDARCTTVTNSVYRFVPNQISYQVRVRAQNTTCDLDSSSWTSYVYFDVHAPVTGDVYLDNNNTAALSGGVCVTGDSLSTIQAGASTIEIEQNGVPYNGDSVSAGGAYSASSPYWDPGNNIVQLNIGEAALYTCTCPAGCVYSGISSPTIGLDFFLIEARDPWFQAEGGSIAALENSGTALRNYISDKCSEDPACSPYLISQSNDVATTSGFLVTGGGSVDLEYTAGEQSSNIDEDGRNILATMDRKIARETYDYFIRLYQFPETPTSDFSTSYNDAQKPTLSPINPGVNAYYHSGDLTIQDAWNIAAGEKISVFVDGNVTIANEIQTEVGGFLGIFASGDITIDPSVEHTVLTDTAGLVEGMFVANGQILIPSRGPTNGGDGKFVGEGTFVGWNGVVMERDYDDYAGRKVENNHKPTEVFRYRSDFVLNAPDEIKVPRYVWREVAP